MLPRLLQRTTSSLTRPASAKIVYRSYVLPLNRQQLRSRILTQPCTPSLMWLNIKRNAAGSALQMHHSRQPLTDFPILDQVIEPYNELIGEQMEPYKNHLKRVINYALLLHPQCTEDELKRLQIAAVFHDIGLWTEPNLSHPAPSCEEAKKYLKAHELESWSAGDIEQMILDHHNLTPCSVPLAEVFRKSDWIDISFGMRRFGLHKEDVQLIMDTFPNLDFHPDPRRLALIIAHLLAAGALVTGTVAAYKRTN
eukprot:CAMPEP_0197024652 /NCGR_PEP_ID=MMETSP1384-20130603/5156_1 /TAXON_ID=29189 /ORGANISM="Ammonia sp." /LENGTH=252 /DNA_ID=CAMNT_0042453069 /DNA_START=30 /DNA_END=788 /DNA_ORIENTATION=+